MYQNIFSVDQHIHALSFINISYIINTKLISIYFLKLGFTIKFSSLCTNFHYFRKKIAGEPLN